MTNKKLRLKGSIMNNQIHIDGENYFITLAITKVMDDILKNSQLNISHLKMAAVVDATPFLELQRFQKLSLDVYDLIFCSEYFYDIVREFSPENINKFVCVDNDIASLRNNLESLIKGFNRNYSTRPYFPDGDREKSLFTPCELSFINDYFSCMRAKQIARVTGNNVKSVSNKKRNIMNKIHCTKNSDFYITLYFLNMLHKVELELHEPITNVRSTVAWKRVSGQETGAFQYAH
ncbi:hypothetical protein ABC733_25040 [Mangrovibacter sp. SLW1]